MTLAPRARHDAFDPSSRRTFLAPAGVRVTAREPLRRFVAAVKAGIPDVALRVLDWAARGDSVYTEWAMSGTIAGRRVNWQGINRNTLDGPKSRAAVSCWDRYALLREVEPERPELDLACELARLQAKPRD